MVFACHRFQYSLFGVKMLPERFQDDNIFRAPNRSRKYPGPPRSAPFIVFAVTASNICYLA